MSGQLVGSAWDYHSNVRHGTLRGTSWPLAQGLLPFLFLFFSFGMVQWSRRRCCLGMLVW